LSNLADYLTAGFWAYEGLAPVYRTNALTVNISALSAPEQALAVSALNAWHEVANLTFTFTSGLADITYTDYTNEGAVTSYGGRTINIPSNWVTNYDGSPNYDIGNYTYQTYLHETGHALGLGHQGPYNYTSSYTPTYAADALYYQDTWQYSVMSYFDQSNFGAGTPDYVVTPQMADIYAIQSIYGANNNTRTGDTTYGFNSNAGSIYSFSFFAPSAMTIYDSGGNDTLDCSGYFANQIIDLTPGNWSSIGGYNNNVGIWINSSIENAIGGYGDDLIFSNPSGGSHLTGGGGTDRFIGTVAGLSNDVINDITWNESITFSDAVSKIYGGNFSWSLNGHTLTYGNGSTQYQLTLFGDLQSGIDELPASSGVYPYTGGGVSLRLDEVGNNLESSGLIIDGSATGNIGYAGDEDWYRVTLSAGVAYVLRAKGFDENAGTLAEPLAGLRDQSGAIVPINGRAVDGPGHDALFVYTPTTSGIYQFFIEASDHVSTGSYSLEIAIAPDLAATSFSINYSYASFAVKNLGPGAAVDSTVGIYLSPDASVTVADVLIGTSATSALGLGAVSNQTASLLFPGSLTAGIYYLGAISDYNGLIQPFVFGTPDTRESAVGDSNTGNNTSNAVAVCVGDNNGNSLFDAADVRCLYGLAGNDFYYVHYGNDQVNEAIGGGTDRVFASVDYALGAGQEVESLTTDNNFGTASVNLTGNEFSQAIYGNEGVNIINGGGGTAADTLVGFGGNDWYFVNHAGDRIIEGPDQGATDRVFAHVSYVLNSGAAVEIISTDNNSGTAAINLTGNELAQVIYGNEGANTINGGGGSAADTLVGFGGNDWYYVSHTADRVLEAVGGGNDRVLTSVDYKLGAGQEIEILSTTNNTGTNSFHLWGNELNNTIYGNAGANVLYGGAGNDTLVGMGGNDNFVFDTTLNAATNVDTISGYTPVTGAAAEIDHIYLARGIFANAGTAGATLAAGAFYSAAGAAGGHDADDRIIYNTSNGWLSYDDDGNGAHAAVHFATISGAPALSHSDFIIL
jgi:hypothetical protein